MRDVSEVVCLELHAKRSEASLPSEANIRHVKIRGFIWTDFSQGSFPGKVVMKSSSQSSRCLAAGGRFFESALDWLRSILFHFMLQSCMQRGSRQVRNKQLGGAQSGRLRNKQLAGA